MIGFAVSGSPDLLLEDWQQLLNKIRQLPEPPGPVVVDIVSPKIHPGRYTLDLQDFTQLGRLQTHLIFPGTLPGADDNVALAVPIEVPGIIQGGEIIAKAELK